MLELAALYGGSFTQALSGALMPGPLFTITISESARTGFRAGPLLMTGHAILELLLVVAIIFGLGAFLQLPLVVGLIGLLGGALLVYFGVDMVRIAGKLTLECGVGDVRQECGRNPLLLGAVTSLANPYWTLWWASIGL